MSTAVMLLCLYLKPWNCSNWSWLVLAVNGRVRESSIRLKRLCLYLKLWCSSNWRWLVLAVNGRVRETCIRLKRLCLYLKLWCSSNWRRLMLAVNSRVRETCIRLKRSIAAVVIAGASLFSRPAFMRGGALPSDSRLNGGEQMMHQQSAMLPQTKFNGAARERHTETKPYAYIWPLLEGGLKRTTNERPSTPTGRRTEEYTDSFTITSNVELLRKQLFEANEELNKEKDKSVCVVCLDNKRDVVLKPCNHFCLCSDCSKVLKECPMCKKKIRKKEKIFHP